MHRTVPFSKELREFNFNEHVAISDILISLKTQSEIHGFLGRFFSGFGTFQSVHHYTDASALNLQVMSQLGLMKCSGLVTSISDSIRIVKLWIPS